MRTTTGVAAIGRSGAVATASDAKAQPWSHSMAGSVLPKFTPVMNWPEHIAIVKPSADAAGLNPGALTRRNASAQATSQRPQVRKSVVHHSRGHERLSHGLKGIIVET